ncbi:MAG: GTPase [Flavobacteriales bacterium CG_4_9_14_3_um_filter_40_17]|nr:MAG: GTPase [Flavobacteriales bacterium CG_4_9_14_3_um_filter_40_17]
MKNQQPDKFVFVYNAQSGRLHGLMDTAHKLLSPATYACKLCALTYGVWSENEKWKAFRTSFPVPLEFLHIDEFQKRYPEIAKKNNDYPFALALESNENWNVFIDHAAFEKMTSLDELMAKMGL